MRDQHFQELMGKVNFDVTPGILDHEYGNVSDQSPKAAAGAPSAEEAIQESQLAFRSLLQRKLPPRKPSPDLIHSLKERIKMIDAEEASL